MFMSVHTYSPAPGLEALINVPMCLASNPNSQPPQPVVPPPAVPKETLQVWACPLVGGAHGVVLMNSDDSQSASIEVSWADLGLDPKTVMKVRDLISHKDLGVASGAYSAKVDSHDARVVSLHPHHP